MTLSTSSHSGRFTPLGVAMVSASLAFGTASLPEPVRAQTAPHYRAELIQAAAQPRSIVGNLLWSCNGTRCVAAKGTSRPLRICRELNRKFGPIAAFSVKGEALSPEELAKCNA